MKSGGTSHNRLIGPGSNDYGRKPDPDEYKPVQELTPELADKLYKGIQKRLYDQRVSKEAVLHHLKQLKAHIGKIKKQTGFQNDNTQAAIDACIEQIDKKIAKVNS